MGKSGVKFKLCAAVGCSYSKVPHDGKSIFYFPKNPERQRIWLKNTGNKELLRHDTIFLTKNRFLCPSHFEDKMFWDNSHSKLHTFAIPTIFKSPPLTDFNISDIPIVSAPFPPTVDVEDVKIPDSDNASLPLPNISPVDVEMREISINIMNNRGEKRAHPDDDEDFIALEPVDKAPHMDFQPATTPRRCWLREGARVRSPPPQPQRRISTNRIVSMSGVKSVTSDVMKVARTAQEYRQMAMHLTRRLSLTQRKSFNRKKLLSRKSVDILVEMSFSPGARLILEGELKNLKKKPKGRVWTLDQKIFWLSVYKRSARAYRFLRKYIVLPSETTLKNILQGLVIRTGIIEPCVELLKHSVPAMKPEDRSCVVLFDEVFLRGRLKYVLKSDTLEGFENYGPRGKTHLIADHALVFMVQGLNSKWVLPCAFYFVSKTCPRTILALLIKDVITALSNLGLNVVASVSDQGPTNRGAISDLKKESGDDVFYCVNGLRIVHIWDIPHIFKNVRNNLLTSDVEYRPGKVARWRDVIDYLMLDNSLCQMSSLTPKHLNPQGRDKMRVCLATEAISTKTADNMEHIHRVTNGSKLPNCMSTVNFIRKADLFFDLTNGPRARSSKEKKDDKV